MLDIHDLVEAPDQHEQRYGYPQEKECHPFHDCPPRSLSRGRLEAPWGTAARPPVCRRVGAKGS